MTRPIRHHETSADLRRYVTELSGGKVNLAFSMGKDAIAAFVALRDEPGLEIAMHHSEVIPGLEFVDVWLDYFERAFGLKIHRIPSPAFFRYLEHDVFQPPKRSLELKEYRFRSYSTSSLHAYAKELAGQPRTTFVATGVRAADSPERHTSIKRNGSLHPVERTFYPVFDWTITDVCNAIERAGVRLPVDYILFGRTFDGIDWRFLHKIKEHFPRDYERILEWVPLADLEIERRYLCPVPPVP